MNFFNKIFNEKFLAKVLVIFVIVFVLSLSNLNIPFFNDLKQVVYNITCPYQNNTDDINVFFANSFNLRLDMPQIKLPMEKYVYKNGIFEFNVEENSILRAGFDGVVKNVGIKDGVNYIEILHKSNVKSVYKNVDIIGVNSNLKVTQGQIIASVCKDEKLEFYLTYNDEIINDYVVKEGEIVWQN